MKRDFCREGHKLIVIGHNKHDKCRKCRAVWRRRYRTSKKGKAQLKRYRNSENGKACKKRHASSEKGKTMRKRAAVSEKGLARRRRWRASEKGKACKKRFEASPKGKAMRARRGASAVHKAWRTRKSMKRKARGLDAFVEGCEKELYTIYARAAQLRSLGFAVEVDHIFPLGLGWHEPANLQIILASENRSKGANPDYVPSIIFK